MPGLATASRSAHRQALWSPCFVSDTSEGVEEVSKQIEIIDEDSLIMHYDGIMIPIEDWDIGVHYVPGWQCKHCGWMVGALGFPPRHICPDEGEAQAERRVQKDQHE